MADLPALFQLSNARLLHLSMSTMPQAWRRRLEPILDHCIQAAIDAVDGEFDPETGHYGSLVYSGCETRERAKEIKNALYRSARHMGVSMFYDIKHDTDGTYSIHYTVVSKQHARAFQVRERGTDRSKWSYDPRAKRKDAA